MSPAVQTLFPEPPSVRRLSLVRLSAEIAGATAQIGMVAVDGEVVRAVRRGRIYFTLRDRAAEIGVMCLPARASRCRVVDGERVTVTGRLQWDNSRGQLRLVAEEVVPVGAGAIAAMLAEVRERLEADGLVARPRLPLPRLPRLVGVICGTEAAVRADFESVVAARFPGYPVEFCEVTVAGPGAADAILAALRRLDGRADVDVIVLARGGGDATQLLPWSDETLCRAIAASRTPVVSAIGHHGDRPLCDDVADVRCGTPSIAAAEVIPDRDRLRAELDELRAAAIGVVWEHAQRAAARLQAAAPAGALRMGLSTAAARLDRCAVRLDLVAPGPRLTRAQDHLGRLDPAGPLVARTAAAGRVLRAERSRLDALNPARVLERGYAVVRQADGQVVRSPDQVADADLLDVSLAGGELRVRVEARP